MARRTVLISGASIAGPALAFWLARYGFDPVIVERAPALRLGGQNVDIQREARTVVRRMGLEEEIRSSRTGELGLRLVDERNRIRAEFPAATSTTGVFTQEFEILRGELIRILFERTRDTTEYVFGNRITALHDHGDRVTVAFEHGPEREVDLVVAADGIRSATRRLIVGDEPTIRHLGVYCSYFTIPLGPSDDGWARWYSAPGGRTVLLRPDNLGTTRALLWFPSPPRGYERLGTDEQTALLRDRFAGAGWETDRVLAGLMEADEVYLDTLGQVIAPRWSNGRAALVGDAAYCPSPISGMGASLALIGPYLLAGTLAQHADPRDAFAAYEALMRPHVDRAQKLPPGTPRLANPTTRLGISVLRFALGVASSPVARRIASRFGSSSDDTFDLPEFPAAG
jgi:2-polyprenyl-6-methoxyphenol hydroxylase-like FAD-dependent oxidoreductase